VLSIERETCEIDVLVSEGVFVVYIAFYIRVDVVAEGVVVSL
jgi:hypothetical protein